MSIAGLTSLGLKLIDFDSDAWHEDDWYNLSLIDAYLQQQNSDPPFATAGGSASAITLDYTPDVVLTNGTKIRFKLAAAITGATTVSVDGSAAKQLRALNFPLSNNAYRQGEIITAIYSASDDAFHIIDPLRSFNHIDIIKGTFAAFPDATADALVVYNGASAGISILCPSPGTGNLAFGDSGNNKAGLIQYAHSGDTMSFHTNGVQRLSIDGSGKITIPLAGTDINIEEVSGQLRIGPTGSPDSGLFFNTTTGRIGINTINAANNFEISGGVDISGPVGLLRLRPRTTGDNFAILNDSNLFRISSTTVNNVIALDNLGKLTVLNTFTTQTPAGGAGLVVRAENGGTLDALVEFRTASGAGLLSFLNVDGATGEFTFSDTIACAGLTLGTPLAVTQGGTGSSTATAARTALGALQDIYRNLPQSPQAASFDLNSSHAGGHIRWTGNAGTLTIRDQADHAYTTDMTVLVINDGSGALAIARDTAVALIWAASGANANRSLAVGGMAFLLRVAADRWFINGSGLT